MRTKEEWAGPQSLRYFEKAVMLQTLDNLWKEHLAAMDYLRQGIHLRGYAQKNPKQEYKRESYELFTQMLETLKREVIMALLRVKLQTEDEAQKMEQKRALEEERLAKKRSFKHEQADDVLQDEQQATAPQKPSMRTYPKVGRNEPCPCGSGKKYKHCHGKIES